MGSEEITKLKSRISELESDLEEKTDFISDLVCRSYDFHTECIQMIDSTALLKEN